MINIHEQIWIVKGVERSVEDSDSLLAYMTHREYTKTGEEAQSFTKRKDTGTSWADKRVWVNGKDRRHLRVSEEGEQLEFDNEPADGFRIVGSVSRWSTSNKLIQVEDPRGFVVEIPTGNLTTLLKHTTVEKGAVMEKCVWGREGNNHILLPVNSEVYKQAAEQTQLNSEKISLAKLIPGQVIKFSVDDKDEYVYLGRGKAVWNVNLKKCSQRNTSHSWYYRNRWIKSENDEGISSEQIQDSKLCFIFKNKTQRKDYASYRNWEYKSSGKCVVTGEQTIPKLEMFGVDFPERLRNKQELGDYCYYGTDDLGRYLETSVVEIKMK